VTDPSVKCLVSGHGFSRAETANTRGFVILSESRAAR
jgi:hypothetical protein